MSGTIENPQKNLMNKLVDITSTIDRIPKNGHNDFHHYDYALESDIKDVVRKEMTERGLQMIPNELSRTITQISSKNGSQQLVSLEVEYTIFDAESGESVKMKGYGDGQDSGDKAVYKAKTGALKYALTTLFMIPTGDDPERPLQPPKSIDKDQYKVIDDLIKEVASISQSDPAKVLGSLKVDMKLNKDLMDMVEEEFVIALKTLQKWKKGFSKRQQQEPHQQQVNQNKPINWGQK